MGGGVSSSGLSSLPDLPGVGRRFSRCRLLLATGLGGLLCCFAGAASAVPEASTPMPIAPSAVDPIARSVLLRCQIHGSAWRPCRMVIDSIGEHWWVLVGSRRFEFRHDGHGKVTIVEGRPPPRTTGPVTPQWRSEGVLCWDGFCVEGPIPLD